MCAIEKENRGVGPLHKTLHKNRIKKKTGAN